MDGTNRKSGRILFWNLIFWVLFVYTVYMCVFYFVPYPKAIWVGVIGGVVALMFAAVKTYAIMNIKPEDTKMQEIETCADRTVKPLLLHKFAMFLVPVLLFLLIWKFINIQTAICFVCGSICSIFAVFAGGNITKGANFKTAFFAGTAVSMAAIGLGLLGLTLLFIIFKDPDIISGFAFGVCFTMLFVHGKNGCENSSKKNEKSASKPCCTAGMTCAGADLFVSYICSILAAITLGAISLAFKGAILPVVISGFAVFASIFALSFVKMKENSNHIMSLRFASFVGIALMLAASYFIVKLWMPMFFGIFWAIVTGAAAGCIIRLSNGYYTCTKRKPVKNIAKALEIGIADGIISSMKVGLISAIFPVIVICGAITGAFWAVGGFENFGFGVYGVAIASVGMLSVTGIIAAGETYNKIAKTAELEKETKEHIGKQLNAITADAKGFAAISSALSALALLYAYISTADIETIDLVDPRLVSSLLFGACLPFLFMALSTGKSGRRAFGIFGKLLAIIAPLIIGIFAGPQALSAMLFGVIASGFCLTSAAANSISVWNSAKKCIGDFEFEDKNYTPEISTNILIKLMVVVSLVCVTLFI